MTTTPDMIRQAAREAYKAGLSVVPPIGIGDEPKRPIGDWKAFQQRRPNSSELKGWFGNGRLQIGTVCGKVSGNLEVIDFDNRDTYIAYVKLARELELAELVDRIEAGYCEDTPGGVHWLYRCEKIAGNTALAHPADKNAKVLIETRGEGGHGGEAVER